jgi:hypothetical protein
VNGFVAGFGFNRPCAVASTVAHDSHHMIVVGTSKRDMALAANRLGAVGGGVVVFQDGQEIALVELPIAGLMSNERAEIVAEKAAKMVAALGVRLPVEQRLYAVEPAGPGRHSRTAHLRPGHRGRDNRILGLKIVPADPDVAADLARPAGEPMLMVEKLFLEDQEPVILTRNFIPQETIVEPYIEDDLRRPVFEFLAQFCQRHLNYYLSDIVPVIATGRLAGRLHLPDPTALLSLEEIGYDDNNEPVIKAYSYFRDDLIRLRLIRRKV